MSGGVTVIDIVAQVTDETGAGVSNSTKNVSKLEQAFKKAQDEIKRMQGMSKLEVIANLKDLASKGLKNITDTGKQLVGKVWNVTVGIIDKVTAPLRGIWDMVTNPIVAAAGFAGITFGIGDTVRTFMDFDKQMSAVGATVEASESQLAQLTEQARELGASTAFSALEVAEGMENLASAGFSVDEVMAAMPGMLDLAAASGEGLARSSEIAAGALRGFGLQASDSQRVADVFARAAAVTNASVSSMGDAMSYLAPNAHAAGISLENTAAAIGILSDATIVGSSAGTHLTAVLSSVIGRSEEAAMLISNLGFEFFDAQGHVKDFTGIVETTAKALEGMTDEQKMATMHTIFGEQATLAMNALLARGSSELERLTENFNHVSNAAKLAAELRMDNLAGDIEELGGSIDDVKIELASKFEPMLRAFVQFVNGKMPLISKAASEMADKVISKIKDIKTSVISLTQSPEWQNAETLWGKIKVAWEKFIAEPFDAWWNGAGKAWLAEKATGIGKGIGTALKTGILTLLGMETGDALSDGADIGRSFMDGFLQGFDGKVVADAIKNAVKGIFKDAATILPGGEEISDTGWLSATLLAAGFAKVGGFGAAGTINKMGSNLIGQAIGAGSGGTITAGAAGVTGGFMFAGIAGAVAGLASAALDLHGATETYNGNLDKKMSAGVKTSMVALGAAIGTAIAPGIGTAIGAGIGGVAAVFAGSPAGEALAGLVDGTGKYESSAKAIQNSVSAFESARDTANEATTATENFFKAVEGLQGTNALGTAFEAQENAISKIHELYLGLISQYDIENGRLEEKLQLVNEIAKAEEKKAYAELQSEVLTGRQNFGDVESRLRESFDKQSGWQNEIDNLYDILLTVQGLEADFLTAAAAQSSGAMTFEAIDAMYDGLNQRVDALNNAAGWNLRVLISPLAMRRP